MQRTLILSLFVVGAAVALAIGAYSALADNGPAGSVASAVIGADEPDGGDEVAVQDGDDGDDVDAQDGDGDDGEGARQIAEVIGDGFGASQEEVLALHEEGIGFGAIFKLYLLSAAGAGTVEELQAAAEEGEGFAFGKRFKEMAEQVSALSAGEDGIAKNLGQLVSGAKKSDRGTPVAAEDDGDEDGGDGPPDHAPAHGRR